MTLGEFDLIDRYFRDIGARRGDVILGVGDDAALLEPRDGRLLVAAVDTLVEATHFPVQSDPESIGHRSLAVNLSDLAAMGAEPTWALLALTLPSADPAWLAAFAKGFTRLARAHGVALVGGDTTSGPLSITVTALGSLAPSRALRRSGGHAGDTLWVSGTPGDAACGLRFDIAGRRSESLSPEEQALRMRFRYPTPRVALGQALAGFASACIDVSDGLVADAEKLAAASDCGLEIDVDRLPLSAALRHVAGLGEAQRLAMTGGDDYELCFSAPESRTEAPAGCTRIGSLTREKGVRLHASGRPVDFAAAGFDHFARR